MPLSRIGFGSDGILVPVPITIPVSLWSSELEEVADDYRQKDGRGEIASRSVSDRLERVLHIVTAAKEVGGDSRFVWKWIDQDPQRSHPVALTEQLYFEIPAQLTRAVASSGGQVHVLDRGGADPVQRARVLRNLARDVDVVFLHVYPEDVVPVLAFSDKAGLPRVVFVAHADHQLWVGVSVCDLFVHLRETGLLLSAERRGIPPSRMALLPIPLEPTIRTIDRADAKKQLGLREDTVLLLSAARPVWG